MTAKGEKKNDIKEAGQENEKEKVSRETLGKYFYDLSKTCFASFVVANVIALFISKDVMMSIVLVLLGILSTIGFARAGYYTLKK